MIDDAIDLVKPLQFDRERLVEVLERRIMEEQGNKSAISTNSNSKLQLNRDLNYILGGAKIRSFGEMPDFMGSFERVAPSEISERVEKIINSYKLPLVTNNKNLNLN